MHFSSVHTRLYTTARALLNGATEPKGNMSLPESSLTSGNSVEVDLNRSKVIQGSNSFLF